MSRSGSFAFLTFTVALIFFSSGSFAHFPVFKSFDIRSENTRPRIHKLFLDRNGLVWCGTDQGIFTFDGLSFKKIFSPDSGLSAVSSFFQDSKNNIWAGFEDGKIYTIKGKSVLPLVTKATSSSAGISAIAEDKTGRLLFATKGEGIFFLFGDSLHYINQDDGLSDDYCYAMSAIGNNIFCTGSDAGLNFISLEENRINISSIGTADGLPDDIVRALLFDKEQFLWIGMQDNGIIKYDCKNKKLVSLNLKNPWNYGQVNSLVRVDSILYVATENNGIILIDDEGNSRSLRLENDQAIHANDMLVDLENNLWIAESIHLYRTSGNKISFIKNAGGKQLRYIHCIAVDKKGNIWFSPDQQLGKITRATDGAWIYKEYKILNRFIDIVSLYFDAYGYLWIGTLGDGVYRFNPETGKARKILVKPDTENLNVLSINGTGNSIYIAGFNSVLKYEIISRGNSDDAVIRHDSIIGEKRLFGDYVYSVFIDTRKRIWLGTDANGVFCIDGEKSINYPVRDNAVHSFTEDKSGNVWFSTADAGLMYIDNKDSLKVFSKHEALSDLSITSIMCAQNGSIIIVHANGFDVFDPKSGNMIYHASEEGLADINCDLNVITGDSLGNIWIGTERGIIRYRPGSDFKLMKPQVVLMKASLFLEEIDYENKNAFGHDENNIRFDYAAFWYSDPQRINYQFILEGYSSKWVQTKDRSASFPKLSPGKYTFRVNASLNDFFDDANEVSYSFIVKPPFWKEWWFRIVAVAIITIIVFILIKHREKRLRNFDRLQKEKIEFQFETLKSQVNPHFLFNSFNTLISVIENTPHKAVEYVEKISEFFRNLVNYTDRNLVPLEEELDMLDNYIFIQKKRFGENLQMKIDLDKQTKSRLCLPPLTLQLLAENAVKHNAISRESPLTISISAEGNRLFVVNNHNKKSSVEKSTGFGLQRIIAMYDLLTSEKVEITNEEDFFSVSIPLINRKNEHTDIRR